jgi:hypothetical protein
VGVDIMKITDLGWRAYSQTVFQYSTKSMDGRFNISMKPNRLWSGQGDLDYRSYLIFGKGWFRSGYMTDESSPHWTIYCPGQ